MKKPIEKIDLTKTVRLKVFLHNIAEKLNEVIERINELYKKE